MEQLIGAVWDTLSPDDPPVTDAERALLDARLAEMEAHPDESLAGKCGGVLLK